MWDPSHSVAEYDTFIHEVGHALGLKHVDYGGHQRNHIVRALICRTAQVVLRAVVLR